MTAEENEAEDGSMQWWELAGQQCDQTPGPALPRQHVSCPPRWTVLQASLPTDTQPQGGRHPAVPGKAEASEGLLQERASPRVGEGRAFRARRSSGEGSGLDDSKNAGYRIDMDSQDWGPRS